MIATVAQMKGGVGKTLIARELGVVIARGGARVLLIDSDRQGDLTRQLGVKLEGRPTLAHVLGLGEGAEAREAIIATEHGPDLIPGGPELASVEMSLVAEIGRERRLLDALTGLEESYDVILIDTPPNLGLLAVNALLAAEVVIAPVSAEDEGSAAGVLELTRTLEKLEGSRPAGTRCELLCVMTRWDERRVAADVLANTLAEQGLTVTARVPSRAAFHAAGLDRAPLASTHPDHPAVAAIGEVADLLTGKVTR